MSPHLDPTRETAFPHLKRPDYQVTSTEDFAYNCIAHAVGKNDKWWWPTDEEVEGVYWPAEAPREETMDAFIAACRTEGFSPCDSSELEPGFEKIALYLDDEGNPAHAARQLPSGRWTRKLGEWEDIEHSTLASIFCPNYGRSVKFLKRSTGKS
jgi:hypothetical protein